ncbi:hypothetical protein Angca_000689, partial [Angiostrongylus cantonensis]
MLLFVISATRPLLCILSIFVIVSNTVCTKTRKKANGSLSGKSSSKISTVKSQDSECRIKEKQQSQQTAQLPSALRPQPVKINRKNGKDEKAAKLKLKKEEKQIEDKFIPYPEVREPTPSQKKRRQRELIEDKKRKIAQGFYQPYSDQDDTLKVVASLDVEHTEDSRKSISNKQVRNGTKDGEMGSVTSRKAPRNDGYNEKSGSSKEYRDNPGSLRSQKIQVVRNDESRCSRRLFSNVVSSTSVNNYQMRVDGLTPNSA